MLDRYEYDCVLLDLMLPGGDGLDILRAIRSKRNPATIFTRFNHRLVIIGLVSLPVRKLNLTPIMV